MPTQIEMKNLALALLLVLLLSTSASAHVGSPDVYYEGLAGPYRLLVTVRVPPMIPGIAQVEAQILDGHVTEIHIVPLRVIGEGSETAPPADRMDQSSSDPQSFTGKLWLMESGSFQVRMTIDGVQGKAELAVPVAAFAQRTLRMQRTTGAILSVLMTLLVLSLIAILGAAVRESQLPPGTPVPQPKKARGRIAMVVTALAIFGTLFLGNMWWTSVADANARDMVYKAPPLHVSVDGDQIKLQMGSSYWHDRRKGMQVSKIIPDHGHLMHLFLVRVPEMDEFYHLHPDETGAELFTEPLPQISGGNYAVFADIVRESGFPDTMTSNIDLAASPQARPLTGDDSTAIAPKISAANWSAKSFALPDGAQVDWLVDSALPRAQHPVLLRFRILNKNGSPATDLEPYMGMPGHLVILRRDLTVFAHIHPEGSVPMAALMLLQKPQVSADGSNATAANTVPASDMSSMPKMSHQSSTFTTPNEITFPYGFPRPGDYRLFLQTKRAGHIETAIFDAHISQ
jgi:hypothetical protein